MIEIDMNETDWPPVYTLRRHRRAKRMILRVCEHNGVVVTIPYGVPKYAVSAFVEANKVWVIQRLNALPDYVKHKDQYLPKTLELAAINESWQVEFQATDASTISLHPNLAEQRLLLTGPSGFNTICQELITSWCVTKAKAHLLPLLQTLSAETGLEYNKVSIRQQKTRWGSCSAQKNISLNYKLLFMPFELARHIILHELCHTVHMDHSKSFWALLKSFDPNCAVNKKLSKNFKLNYRH